MGHAKLWSVLLLLLAAEDAGGAGGDRGSQYLSGGDEEVGEPLFCACGVERVSLAEAYYWQ